MRIAAIDVGSNSVHMVVVEVSASGGFEVVDREKEMVRLGSGTLTRGQLPAAAMRAGLEVLARYRRIAESHGVDKILAVATSAVREASNGEDFLERVGRQIGVWPKAISGEEEARLVYLAALHSIHLEGRRTLVLDVGGGSIELALGVGATLEHTVSEKLGVLRMSEQFAKSDPLSPRDEQRLVEHLDRSLSLHAPRIRESGFETAVGTSGTILALGALARELGPGAAAESLHHVTVGAEAIHALRKRLIGSDLRGRLKLARLDETRADIIVTGAVILDTLLDRLGVRELVLCEWALREGILLDYIHGHPRSLARAEAYPDVRRRSVVSLAERCVYDEPHARHVAGLAVALLDATQRRHGLGEAESALLEHAALLHDIGHHISYPGHHKHSYYLIKNGDLRGFSPTEIEMLANVARYHRRGLPRKRHSGFASLPREKRRVVRVLAGCLRLADSLDRSHRQVVRRLAVTDRGSVIRVRCEVEGDCELELWGAGRRTDLLEHELGVPVRVDAQAAAPAAAVRAERA